MKKRFLVAAFALMVASAAFAQRNTTVGTPWTCSVDNIAGSLTTCPVVSQANFPANATIPATAKLFITDIHIVSTTATGGQFTLRYGTGANCGTTVTTLFPAAAGATARFGYVGNTAGTTAVPIQTPIVVPAGQLVCIICVATNTCTAQITGYAQ